ncbi:MAG: putative glycoside hydrolase [Anaerolineae bacterium]
MSQTRITFFLALFIALNACQGQSAPPPLPPTPTPSSLPEPTATASSSIPAPLHLVWFYKPPSEAILQQVATGFDLFILTHKDEDNREALRARGAAAPFLQYLLLLEIHDPGSCTARPFGNQVAYQVGDFCQIKEQHPDWFLVDKSGQPISLRKGYWMMDPGNAEYRLFWLNRMREMLLEFGWDGIFIDNVEASLAKFRSEGRLPAAYRGEEDFQKAVEEFLSFLSSSYFRPAHIPLIANIVSVNDTAVWKQYVAYLDGAMIENFATGWEKTTLSAQEWETQMDLAEWALANGKILILVAQGEKNDLARQEFALASYWLINNGHAYFRYANSDEYNSLWDYSNYNQDLGAALGPRTRQGNRWVRQFEDGQVTVDPSTLSAEIYLDAPSSNIP